MNLKPLPPVRLRQNTRLAWEPDMTVCIAAVADERAIVIATDTKITTGYYSAESVTLKLDTLLGKWWAMVSGKMAQRIPLINKLRIEIGRLSNVGLTDVTDICTQAYIQYGRQLATEKVLSKFKMTLDD